MNASKWTAICSNANPYFSRNNRFLRRCIGFVGAGTDGGGRGSAISGTVAVKPSAGYHIVQAGDTLWDISALFLTDPYAGPICGRATHTSITRTSFIRAIN